MRIATVLGTRPQLIKLAALEPALRARHDLILIDTGQHYDEAMAGGFFAELSLSAPDHILRIAGGGGGEQVGRMLVALEPILVTERPDAVLVLGDTNSTLAGALGAAKLGIPVAHAEAGLRSFDRSMPEEINRVVTDMHERPSAPSSGARRPRPRDMPGMFQHLGRALVLLRSLRDKPQAEVAREAGIGKSQLSKYETGRELPKLESLEKVLRSLDAGMLDLAGLLAQIDERAARLGGGLDLAGQEQAGLLLGGGLLPERLQESFGRVLLDLLALHGLSVQHLLFGAGRAKDAKP